MMSSPIPRELKEIPRFSAFCSSSLLSARLLAWLWMHFKLLMELRTVCDLIGTCFICNAPLELGVACWILARSDRLQVRHLVLEPSTCFFLGCAPCPSGRGGLFVCFSAGFSPVWDSTEDRALLYGSTRAALSCPQTRGRTSAPFCSAAGIRVQKSGCFSETHPNIAETLWVRNWVKTWGNSRFLFFNPLSGLSVLAGSCKAQTLVENRNSWGNSIILSLLGEVRMTRCVQSLWMENRMKLTPKVSSAV